MFTRLLEEEDLRALLGLYAHLHDNDLSPVHDHDYKDQWQNILADGKIRYVGLFVHNELLSACHIVLVPNLSRGARPYAVVENVVTHREHRCRGYGSAVVQHAVELAWQARCYKIMTQASGRDPQLFRFCESVGFAQDKKMGFVLNNPDYLRP